MKKTIQACVVCAHAELLLFLLLGDSWEKRRFVCSEHSVSEGGSKPNLDLGKFQRKQSFIAIENVHMRYQRSLFQQRWDGLSTEVSERQRVPSNLWLCIRSPTFIVLRPLYPPTNSTSFKISFSGIFKIKIIQAIVKKRVAWSRIGTSRTSHQMRKIKLEIGN